MVEVASQLYLPGPEVLLLPGDVNVVARFGDGLVKLVRRGYMRDDIDARKRKMCRLDVTALVRKAFIYSYAQFLYGAYVCAWISCRFLCSHELSTTYAPDDRMHWSSSRGTNHGEVQHIAV